jgi:S1-C subfamily serine protease
MEQQSLSRQIRWIILSALIAGVAGGLMGALLTRALSDNDAPSQAAPAVEQRYVTLEEDSAVSDVAEKALPSIVTVNSKLGASAGRTPLPGEETASGSGVIIDDRGYIVTNEHVIDGAGEISVVLHDGRELPATLVSADDPFTDLAVLKIDADGLQALSWGDSDALKLGQKVVAIGSALSEFRDSVTTGVVSGSHRRWANGDIVMEDMIQTDAAVNHGDSGGALLNTQGELVGLNTSVIRSTDQGETVEGIAFAISSNVAAPIAETIIDKGSYPRPYLGISHQDLTPEMSSIAGLPVDHGAAVGRVSPGTPAADAGIQQGDIILKMGDTEVNQDMPFLNALSRLTPGQTVPVVLERDGEEITVQVTPTERERVTQ